MLVEENKRRLIQDILSTIYDLDEIISVSLVGSFVANPGMQGLSDIDVVVVCKKLRKDIFEKCKAVCHSLTMNDYGLEEHDLFLNTTFGPLKFNQEKLVVIHLMIYDIEGHIEHVLKSPFTCYDWERSAVYIGKSLKEICPVGVLQLSDFTSSRRSSIDYLADLESGTVSFREYVWHDNKPKEEKKSFPFDSRAKGEFCYHIVKNSLCNFFKFESQQNTLPDDQQLRNLAERVMPNRIDFIDFFFKLRDIKSQGGPEFPQKSISWAAEFVDAFSDFLRSYKENVAKTHFVRHAPTALNDGRFLGCKSNPPIIDFHPEKNNCSYDTIFSSPLLRAIQTAQKLCPNANIQKVDKLREIDYGLAEGLNLSDLSQFDPDMARAWDRGEDPRFPKGENTEDVVERLNSFIKDELNIANSKKQVTCCLVVSHNVVLRCLIGQAFNLPMKTWFRISVPYNYPLEFIRVKGQLVANIPRSMLASSYIHLSSNLMT